jgi:hypothetical protein
MRRGWLVHSRRRCNRLRFRGATDRQCKRRAFRLLGADDRTYVLGKHLGRLQPFANGAWPCYLRITCTIQGRRYRENCCGPFARSLAAPIGALLREQRASRPDFSSNGGIGCLFCGVDHGGSSQRPNSYCRDPWVRTSINTETDTFCTYPYNYL